jgi:homoserine kinase type II
MDEDDLIPTSYIDPANHLSPRTSLQLTLAQLQKLADDFDLGRIVQMDRPLDTQCNTTDPFRTGQGTFLLRARHGEEFVERVEYLHYMIDRLIAEEFPTAAVVRSRTGKSWTTWGERIVEIHRFIPHDPGIHRDWRRMNAAASALGDLHTVLAKAALDRTPVPPEMRNDANPQQCWMLLREAEPALSAQIGVHPQAEDALAIVRQAQGALEPLMGDYARIIGNLPWMTIHGDYHFWNVLYRADQIAAVVDFDFVQERERLFDIAYAMQSIILHLRHVQGVRMKSFSDLAWSNARIWIDLYDEAAPLPLTAAERAWLPMEILRIFLVCIATSTMQEDPVATVLKNGRDLPMFLWISEQKDLFQ